MQRRVGAQGSLACSADARVFLATGLRMPGSGPPKQWPKLLEGLSNF